MSNSSTPGQNSADRIALIYLRASDVTPKEDLLYSEAELTAHYFADDAPLRRFWTEVSHGNYRYTGKVFYPDKLPVTQAQIKATGEHYVISALHKALGPSGLPVPGLDLAEYDLVFVLLAESPEAPQTGYVLLFGGGFNTSDIVVNGKSTKLRLVSFVYRKFTSGYWFSIAKPGTRFTGIQDHERLVYPELGLWNEDATMLHEWGHSIGLYSHAHFLRVADEPLQGDVRFTADKPEKGSLGDDYGDYFDIMGSGHYAMHPNAAHQDKLGWYKPENIVRISQTTRDVRLTPLEGNGTIRAAVITPPQPIQLQLAANASQWAERLRTTSRAATFYVEYRQGIGFDKHLSHAYLLPNTQGLLIHLSMPSLKASERNSWLLDMSAGATSTGSEATPTAVAAGATAESPEELEEYSDETSTSSHSYDDHHLAALAPGYRFYDPNSQVLIGNIRPDGSNGLTFDVTLGALPGMPTGVSQELPVMLERVAAKASSEVSEEYNGKPQTAARLIEGPNSGGWWWSSVKGSDPTPWIQVELASLSIINSLTVRWKMSEGHPGPRPMQYQVKSSTDGQIWADTGVSHANVADLTPNTMTDTLPGWSAPTRFIRIEMSDSSYKPVHWFPNWKQLSSSLPKETLEVSDKANTCFSCCYLLAYGTPLGS